MLDPAEAVEDSRPVSIWCLDNSLSSRCALRLCMQQSRTAKIFGYASASKDLIKAPVQQAMLCCGARHLNLFPGANV